MLYTGKFKNVKGETIQVNIITNNDKQQTTELTFANESPVIIMQNSSDGIFSPIKSRSCTITVVAKDPYFDMYSGQSHGTIVEVNNLTKGECLFFGYMTPCEYNQPYLYLNEIELEAVDAVSTLQDFKYKYLNNYNSNRVSIASVVKYCLSNIAGYRGGIFVPFLGLRMKIAWDNSLYPMEAEYISEQTFFDDDKPLSCYEILEEICNFYNLSLVPYGEDVYFIDYESVAKYDNTWWDANISKWKNLNESNLEINEVDLSSNISLTVNDYAGDDQNIEIDEVYNKVSVKADVNEIEDEELIYDPMKDANSATFYDSYESGMNRTDGANWKHITRMFEFIKGSYGGWLDYNGDWQTIMNVNSEPNPDPSGINYILTDKFTNTQISARSGYMEFPYRYGDFFNVYIVGQTCIPAQQFGYESSSTIPIKANWDDRLLFFPQAQWLYEYYKQNGGIDVTGVSGGENVHPWWRNFCEEHLCGTYPVLRYNGKKDFQFSPADTTKTNYLIFTGDLLWQQNCTYDDVNYHLWTSNTNDGHYFYGGTLFPIKEAGAHDTHDAYTRTVGESDSGKNNQGWPMLKIKLRVGNKYWNGSSWQTTECTAWIPYHKETTMNGNTERLIWSDYNKPVTNFDYTSNIEKEGYAIPIKFSDYLYGKLKLEIYMPFIPWSFGLIKQMDGVWNINYELTPPVIFMKGLSLELVSVLNESVGKKWLEDLSSLDDKEDDIIYENEINSQNVTEMDDLELKINTYNDKKPIAESYIIQPNIINGQIQHDIDSYHTEGFYRPLTHTTLRQELNVVNRYVEHYSSPKKIYNCQVHDYYKPWICVKPNALDNIKMIVDEQEYDVKANTNELKLIEY